MLLDVDEPVWHPCWRLDRGKSLVTRRAVVCLVLLALTGWSTAAANATPGFFTGVVEQHSTLGGPVQTSFADLGLGSAYVWVHWASGHALSDEDVASVTDTAGALPPGTRVVVGVGGPGRRDGVPAVPLDAATRDEYCGFVRELLDRVPAVRDVVLWNEPNKTAGWAPQYDGSEAGAASVAPAAYVALLARCWDVLHAFRADVNVIAPNTSPNGNDNPAAPSNISHSPAQFIRQMGLAYRASGRTARIFDTVAHHAYGIAPRERPWRSHLDEKWISQGDWSRLMSALTEAFSGTGQAIPGQCFGGACVWIWYTEAGFQTTPADGKAPAYSGTEPTPNVIPDDVGGDPPGGPIATFAPDLRAQFVDAVDLAACQPYVQAFFNYRLLDDAPLAEWQSGLLWADGTRKSSYAYAKAAIAAAHAGTVDCGTLKGGPAPTPESVPPAAPAGLVASPGVKKITLSWRPNSDPDVLGYYVERGPSPSGPWTRLTQTPVSAAGFTDTVPNGETRHYAVRAVDTADNESGLSSSACGTPTGARATYAPATVHVRAGRARGGVTPARLAANDARRIEVAGGPRGRTYRASLEAGIPLPRCARAPERLRLELDLSALPDGARAAVTVLRAGRWTTVGAFRAGTHDRSRSLAVPLRAAARGRVAARVTVTGVAPFRARVDVLRLAVSS